MERLKYLSNATIESLREGVANNAERYRSGDFTDLMKEGGEWAVELGVEGDLTALNDLDPSGKPEAEIKNSLLVWRALNGLSPALAYEEGIWVRLTHVECLEYSRKRWPVQGNVDEKLVGHVHTHFFADTLARRRDDNALSRLWWNGHIAHQISPQGMRGALEIMLKRADARLSFIERSVTGSRQPLAAGVVRTARQRPWITESEASFRSFMKVLNKRGGGMVFEAMADTEIDAFMLDCADRAQAALTKTPMAAAA